jgi:hypothetical protein
MKNFVKIWNVLAIPVLATGVAMLPVYPLEDWEFKVCWAIWWWLFFTTICLSRYEEEGE